MSITSRCGLAGELGACQRHWRPRLGHVQAAIAVNRRIVSRGISRPCRTARLVQCGAQKLQVVFVSTEVAPWSKVGGLGDVLASLPAALAARGHRVMTVAPRYANYADVHDTGIRAPIQEPATSRPGSPVASSSASSATTSSSSSSSGGGGDSSYGSSSSSISGSNGNGDGRGSSSSVGLSTAEERSSGVASTSGRTADPHSRAADYYSRWESSSSFNTTTGSSSSSSSSSSSNRSSSSSSNGRAGAVTYYMTRRGGVDRVFVDHPLFCASSDDDRSPQRIYTYRHPGGAEDLAASYSVLCQAALAAPVLLWGGAEGLEGPDKELLACLLNGRQPGGADEKLRLQALLQYPQQLVHGLAAPVRLALPGVLSRHDLVDVVQGAAATAAKAVARLGAEGSTQTLARQQQQQQQQQQDMEKEQQPMEEEGFSEKVLFVGNDWPCGVLPLWLQTYKQLAADEAAPEPAAQQQQRHEPQQQQLQQQEAAAPLEGRSWHGSTSEQDSSAALLQLLLQQQEVWEQEALDAWEQQHWAQSSARQLDNDLFHPMAADSSAGSSSSSSMPAGLPVQGQQMQAVLDAPNPASDSARSDNANIGVANKRPRPQPQTSIDPALLLAATADHQRSVFDPQLRELLTQRVAGGFAPAALVEAQQQLEVLLERERQLGAAIAALRPLVPSEQRRDKQQREQQQWEQQQQVGESSEQMQEGVPQVSPSQQLKPSASMPAMAYSQQDATLELRRQQQQPQQGSNTTVPSTSQQRKPLKRLDSAAPGFSQQQQLQLQQQQQPIGTRSAGPSALQQQELQRPSESQQQQPQQQQHLQDLQPTPQQQQPPKPDAAAPGAVLQQQKQSQRQRRQLPSQRQQQPQLEQQLPEPDAAALGAVLEQQQLQQQPTQHPPEPGAAALDAFQQRQQPAQQQQQQQHQQPSSQKPQDQPPQQQPSQQQPPQPDAAALDAFQRAVGRRLSASKVALAIHNFGYQGRYQSTRAVTGLGLPAAALEAFLAPADALVVRAVQLGRGVAGAVKGLFGAAEAEASSAEAGTADTSRAAAAGESGEGNGSAVTGSDVGTADGSAEAATADGKASTAAANSDAGINSEASTASSSLGTGGSSVPAQTAAAVVSSTAAPAASKQQQQQQQLSQQPVQQPEQQQAAPAPSPLVEAALWAVAVAAALSGRPQDGDPQNSAAAAAEPPNGINWMRAGVTASDALVTVSPGYAQELLKGVGAGAAGAPDIAEVLGEKGLMGVRNGIDEGAWDPKTDPLLPRTVRYGVTDAATGKAAAKQLLQTMLGLAVEPNAPLFAFVGRLEAQKGADVVVAAAPRLLADDGAGAAAAGIATAPGVPAAGGAGADADAVGSAVQSSSAGPSAGSSDAASAAAVAASSPQSDAPANTATASAAASAATASPASPATPSPATAGPTSAAAAQPAPPQLAVLGRGQSWVEGVVRQLPINFPGRAAGVVDFNEPLAHLLLAAADFVLLPSRFEPCGLVALAALRYGAIPIAAETGGLIEIVGGELGHLMPPVGSEDSSAEFRAAVSALVDTSKRAAAELGTPAHAARRTAAMCQEVGWDAPAAQWEQLLLELAQQEEEEEEEAGTDGRSGRVDSSNSSGSS